MDTNESTDFDFFDTPRNKEQDSDQESPQDTVKSKPPLHTNLPVSKNVEKTKEPRHTSPSVSESSDNDDDYSSDSVSSLSDSDQSQNSQNRSKNSTRSISSGSIVSSSYRNSRKTDKRSSNYKSQKASDGNASDESASHSSGSRGSSGSWRKSKGRKNESRKNRGSTSKEIEEDSYSSSAYSDGEENSHNVRQNSPESDRRKMSKNKKGNNKQAWGKDEDYKGSKNKSQGGRDTRSAGKERPKTAKPSRRQERLSPDNSDSDALSDSDITDVSPIESPRTPDAKVKGHRNQIGAAGDGGGNSKSRFKPLPSDDSGTRHDFDDSEMSSRGIDLQILMKAVGELEKKKRVEANTRRVMFAPMTLKRNDKANYTFDKDRTTDIDRENDRLLKEIVKQVNADRRKQYFKTQAPPKTKITPSAINRDKEMRRIESDNLSFLKRLQKVKPTSTICRNNQLRAYENTKLHGVPIATLHPVGSRASSRASSQLTDSYSSIGSRTRSLTSLHSVASTVRSTTSSKRSSRPSSATKRIDSRPEWNDRW